MAPHLWCSLAVAGAVGIAACDFPPLPRTTDGGDRLCAQNADCTGDLPVCDTDRKVCGQCFGDMTALCTGKTPICQSDRCAPCAQHADCKQSNACVSDGSCALDTDVAYLDPAGTDNATCTKPAPCTRIAKALATRRPYVKLRGTASGDNVVAITDQTVTLLTDPGAVLDLSGVSGGLQISGASVVEIDDLLITHQNTDRAAISIPSGSAATLVLRRATVADNLGGGITSAGGNLVLEGTTIRDNAGIGISCTGGSLKISRSTIAGNNGGGISLATSPTAFDITNSFIYRNGSPLNGTVGGVVLFPSSASPVNRFEFNTVIDNLIKDGQVSSAGVVCDQLGFVAPNNLIARNLVGNDPNRSNANTTGQCSYPTSTVSATLTALRFRSPDTSPYDYHINPDSAAVGQATSPSRITVDFDGDPRPANASDQGADQHKP